MDCWQTITKGTTGDNSTLLYSSSDEEDKVDDRVDSDDPEEMFQNIQYQKEIIANIRTRPWPMKRKLKVLKYGLFFFKEIFLMTVYLSLHTVNNDVFICIWFLMLFFFTVK